MSLWQENIPRRGRNSGPGGPEVGCVMRTFTFIALLGLVFFVMTIIVDVIVNPTPNLGPGYDSSYFNDSSTLTFIATPGEQYTINIRNVASSIGGQWAAPQGLRFTLDGPSGISQVVLQPKAVDWGSQLAVVCQNGNCPTQTEIDLPCSLTVSSVPGPAEQTITGRITGTITYPEEQPSGYFQNNNSTMSVPIKIQLISPQHYAQITQQRDIGVIVILIVWFLSIVPIGIFARWVGRYARDHMRWS
jgi:hypothetical protein